MQQEMFELVERWRESPLGKTDFLKDTGITKDKFNYWVTKYNKIHFGKKRSKALQKIAPVDFKEVFFTRPELKVQQKKVLEMTTSSGMIISVFE